MTDKAYIYRGAPETRVFGALPAGDYSFVITAAEAPYFKNNKWIVAVKLTIQPQGVPVFANPWTGKTKDGEERDGIGELLLAVNRAPTPGNEPEWGRLIGAKGKCRLKVEIAQLGALEGKEVNKVSFWHVPKQVGPTEGLSRSGQAQPSQSAGPVGPDLNVEPDDIPFSPNTV